MTFDYPKCLLAPIKSVQQFNNSMILFVHLWYFQYRHLVVSISQSLSFYFKYVAKRSGKNAAKK